MTESFSVSLAISGSGGSGSVTAGLILLEALADAGYYALMTRSYGPQIRGGESAVMLRISDQPVSGQGDTFDLLVSLDWLKVERFAEEIPLRDDSLIVGDSAAGELPPVLAESAAQFRALPLKATADDVPDGRSNMVALGVIAAWLGLDDAAMQAGLQQVLGRKGEALVTSAMAGIRAGKAMPLEAAASVSLGRRERLGERWSITGNEACGFGALAGGVRFAAAYPITPASDLLEYLAPRLEQQGGTLLQAEDELASINMVIGASWGGVVSMTATSGPGLSLMSEAFGLAVAAEVPLLLVNVTRGGPSTGIPTKTEQSDLNLALYGTHGDAPHLVMAPDSISDCVATTAEAVAAAEALQVPAIVLTDQMMAQARVITRAPDLPQVAQPRLRARTGDAPYARYAQTESGISPVSFPGDAGLQYTADGLEHNAKGTPSSLASDHLRQSAKRRRKLEAYDFGERAADLQGEGEELLIAFGSTVAAVREAAARLAARGRPVKVLVLRLLSPLPKARLKAALADVKRCHVIELNESGQLFHCLRGSGCLPERARSLCRPGPLFFRPGEIVEHVLKELADEQ